MPDLAIHAMKWVPFFPTKSFPEGEQKAVFLLNSSLQELSLFRNNFEAVLKLHEFAYARYSERIIEARPNLDELNLFGEWRSIAGRDGAMTIYHFGMSMESTRQLLPSCPTLNRAVDHGILRSAVKSHKSSFPRFWDMRIAVAHSAEYTSSPIKFDTHATNRPFRDKGIVAEGTGHVFKNLSHNRSFSMSFGGVLLSYEIDETTLDKLDTIKSQFYSSFKHVPHVIPE